jgi:hypothetical protein
MTLGSAREFMHGMNNSLIGRRELVATGRVLTPFGSIGDLVMTKAWRDKGSSAECFELTSPENVMAPIAQFWNNGDLFLFERVGFEGPMEGSGP